MQPRSRASLFLIAITAAISRCPAQVRDETTGRLVPTGDMGVVFVLLPGGTLPDGTPAEDNGRETEGAKKRLTVRLGPFFLSKYELAQGQWLRLTGTYPNDRMAPRSQDDRALPVEWMYWFECEEVLRREGWVLPSELQWEYSCRAGTTTKWWTGATEESLKGKENGCWEQKRLLPVGSMAPNPFGLFDVSGNLWEWCLDRYGEYGTERAGDGLRPNQGSAFFPVIRGGYYSDVADRAQSGHRLIFGPTSRMHQLGVRPARTLQP